jgi:hypothetical protein
MITYWDLLDLSLRRTGWRSTIHSGIPCLLIASFTGMIIFIKFKRVLFIPEDMKDICIY